MNGSKGFLSSKGIWGGLLSMAGGLSFAGYTLSADDAASIVPLLQGIGTAFAGLLAIYGRVKASKRIGPA